MVVEVVVVAVRVVGVAVAGVLVGMEVGALIVSLRVRERGVLMCIR